MMKLEIHILKGKEWGVFLDGVQIAQFKTKEDAELFMKAKEKKK